MFSIFGKILFCFAITHFHGVQSLAVARNMSVQEMEGEDSHLQNLQNRKKNKYTHTHKQRPPHTHTGKTEKNVCAQTHTHKDPPPPTHIHTHTYKTEKNRREHTLTNTHTCKHGNTRAYKLFTSTPCLGFPIQSIT